MGSSRLSPGLLGAALAAILALGCGAGRSNAPEATLDRFAHALRFEDYEDAYALLAAPYRAQVPYDEFVRRVRESPDEVTTLLALLASLDAPADVTAELRYGEGEALRMVLENGEWRIEGNVVDFYDQSTPRAALRSFVRAMERRRYDVVLRFVPRADLEGRSEERMRAAWESESRAEIERLLESLRASLDNPIEEVGDRATMAYGQRYTVQFLREDGVWKIEDPD